MTDSIYSTPQASLLKEQEESQGAEFYVVSPKKFGILFLGTMGLYSLYWFYENWQRYRAYHKAKLWPVPRALFNIFFAHSLFERIDTSVQKTEQGFGWNPGVLAAFYVVTVLVSTVVDQLATRSVWSPYTDIWSLVFVFITYAILLKAQRAINLSQGDPEGAANSQFTGANFFWLVVGAIFWVLSIIGLLILFDAIIV